LPPVVWIRLVAAGDQPARGALAATVLSAAAAAAVGSVFGQEPRFSSFEHASRFCVVYSTQSVQRG
jgi:hypothetical protein